MHSLRKGIPFSLAFSVLVKNKINLKKKKKAVPSKTHLWARTRQLAIPEKVISKSEDIQRRVVRI